MKPIKINLDGVKSIFESEIAGALLELGYDSAKIPIVSISSYDGIEEQKTDYIKSTIEILDIDKCVLITTAYISTNEFSPECYDMTSIPVDKILLRESNLLESLGFININDYIGYKYKIAFIYSNNIGNKIVKYLRRDKV